MWWPTSFLENKMTKTGLTFSRKIFYYGQRLQKNQKHFKNWKISISPINNLRIFLYIFVKVNHFPGDCSYTNKMMHIKLKKLGYNQKLLWHKSSFPLTNHKVVFLQLNKIKDLELVCKKITTLLSSHAHRGCTGLPQVYCYRGKKIVISTQWRLDILNYEILFCGWLSPVHSHLFL